MPPPSSTSTSGPRCTSATRRRSRRGGARCWIELAKGGDKAGPVRELLERLEGQLEGKSAAERARLSMLAMAESARLMTDQLAQLSEQVREHAALQSRLPRGAA